MKLLVACVALFAICSVLISGQKCKKEDNNPKCCFNLNAVSEQIFSSYYRQNFVDMYTLSEKKFVVLLRYFNGASFEKRTLEGDKVVLYEEGQKPKILIEQVRTNKNLDKGKKLDQIFGTNQTFIHSLGNLVPITFGEQKIQQRFVLGLKVPREADQSQSSIFFSTLRMDSGESQKPYGDGEGIQYKYPFEGAERFFDRDGTDKGIRTSDETFNYIESANADLSHLSVKTFFNNPTSEVKFAALIANKGSLKLVKYTAQLEESNAKIVQIDVAKKLVVPFVIDAETEKPTGGLLHISKTNNAIYVVTHINKDQYNAFKTLHSVDTPVTFGWPEGKKKIPVFMKFNPETLRVELIDSLPLDYSTSHDKFTAASMDVRNDHVIVVGNTHNDFYARNAEDNQLSWFSRIQFKEQDVLDRQGGFLDEGVNEKGHRFIANAVSFSAENGNENKFVVGGKSGSYLASFQYSGKVFLVEILPAPKQLKEVETGKSQYKVWYNMEVGEDGSNAVKMIRRISRVQKEGTQDEMLILGNEMGAPTTAPPEDESRDTTRGVKAGVWVLDCAESSWLLELIVTTGFFIYFALCAVILSFTIIFYSSVAMYKYIMKKLKKKSVPQYEKM